MDKIFYGIVRNLYLLFAPERCVKQWGTSARLGDELTRTDGRKYIYVGNGWFVSL